MAYVSKELKAKLAPKIKTILKKYGMQGTISVTNHSTLNVNIKSGNLFEKSKESFRDGYAHVGFNVNAEHFNYTEKKFIEELNEAMNDGNHDDSDYHTDYFNVGWYTNIKLGKWDTPYVYKQVNQKKPKVGQIVTSIETGKYIGDITEIEGNICYFHNICTNLNDSIIWKFSDNYTNTQFTWK